ncbi:MAG: hypothetical protein ACKO38_10070 [Planctomycetota bacterium]
MVTDFAGVQADLAVWASTWTVAIQRVDTLAKPIAEWWESRTAFAKLRRRGYGK